MTDLRSCDLYLVGSLAVPSDTVEEAMRIIAEQLGDRLSALPDGEVGPRGMWAGALGVMTYSRHPDLVEAAEDEYTSPVRRSTGRFGRLPEYRAKDGAVVRFEGYLPYGDAAVSSYRNFRALKESGAIAADVRFQVALPTPFAGVVPFFDRLSDWPAMARAFQRALTADIGRILEVVPPDELALQWDYCTEVCDVVGAVSGRRELNIISPWNPVTGPEEKLAEHTAPDYLRGLAEGVPDEVRFGYHVCLGTFPEFPTTPVDDLGWVVRIANALVANTARRVDFLHLPALPDVGRDFYAPLAGLEIGEAKVFLGVGHRDDAEAIATRARLAAEFLPDFGISHYCGYGRDDRHRAAELLAELRRAADLLSSGTG